MSGIVVLIGFILLVPSVLGVLAGGAMLFATGSSAGSAMETIRTEAQQRLRAASVPEDIVTKVIGSRPLTRKDSATLTPAHFRAIESATLSMAAGTVGAGIGTSLVGGASIFVMVVSLVGGLLGWLLVMRKTVLQCNNCGAVTAAS